MPSYPDDPEIRLVYTPEGGKPRYRRLWAVLALLFVGFLFFHNTVPLYTDWLWFGEVGYRGVFTTTIRTKTLLFFLFGGAFFTLFYANLAYARRLAPSHADRLLWERFGPEWGLLLKRGLVWGLFAVAVFLSLFAGRIAAESWTSFLEFTHATPFGIADPVFGNDVGFYLFRLPFLNFLQSFLLVSLLMTFLAVVIIHVADRAIETWTGLPDAHPGVRAQLLLLLGLLALTQAFGTRLNAYDLLTNQNGVFTGAGYTDLHYRLLALNAQIALLVLTALACLVAIARKRDFRWPTIGVGAWLVTAFVLGGLLPSIGEKIYVEPNQLAMEQEYIKRNIEFTRQGFGLADVRRVDNFPADESLNAAALHANRDTLANVRLWDYPYIGKVYAQTQTVKTFYKFEQDNVGGGQSFNVDVDRYTIDGRLRQVTLAARELNPDSLTPDVQNWQNKRLGYTHGYGLVMSPVNKSVQGGPQYFLQGFPPTASTEAKALQVKQPKIYYGQLAHEYVFVDTAQQEFDPSQENRNGQPTAATAYTGRGGIRIGDAPLAKLAFSLRLGDPNILLAKGFTNETRVLFRRDIRERVQLVAPFIQQDTDPYLILTDEGKLVWMIDCYTLSDRYPYATPTQVQVNPFTFVAPNYIRNSVKATVDAYDGSVNLYLTDPKDPIARTYARIFPDLLKPLSAMPQGVRAHIRYPEDLFRLQRSVYATYHVDDPGMFFRKEDAWAIPVEPNEENGVKTQKQMEPYYVIMRLPDMENSSPENAVQNPRPKTRNGEEFLLMSPLAPLRQEDKNILGWMCARCDGENYGQLVLYRFPQQKSVNGPSQIVSLLNGDSAISKELSLLRSGGSTATFGNLLVIPIENSLLYIAPLYVESTNSSKIPQLQRVAVAFGQRYEMANTLEEALTRLFPGYDSDSPPETTPAPTGDNGTPNSAPVPNTSVPAAVRSLIESAGKQYEAAQQKLKSGDFAGYGAATKELQRTLNELRQMVGTPAPKP